MSAPVCGFHCHWKHWRSLAASTFCWYFAASPTHSGLFRDFPQCFIACSWVRWCTQIETMEHGSIIRTHLLIDYKEYADVSFTDSLKPTGSSNMAHHQFSMQCVWVVSQRLRLTRRRSGSSCTPPEFLPVQFIAASGSLHEPNLTHPEILYSCQSEFSYLSLYRCQWRLERYFPCEIFIGTYSHQWSIAD